MRDRKFEDILKRAADTAPDVDPALLDRVSKSIQSTLRPVRPLPPSWILAGGLILNCWAVAVAGGTLLGPFGIRKMSILDIGLIFPALGALTWITSVVSVAESIPGSRRLIAPRALCAAGCVGLAAVFALLFQDYRTERFLSQGIVCLKAGLLHAIPAFLAAWFLLKRGFAVNSVSSGFAKGTLASLAGIAMLELHCANFEAPHVIVWHIAVMPLSAAIGALIEWRLRRSLVPQR